MSEAEEPEERVLAGAYVEKAGDVVVLRGERVLVARCTKRWQAFVPRSFASEVAGLSDVFAAAFLGGLRGIPPLMAPGWQVGVEAGEFDLTDVVRPRPWPIAFLRKVATLDDW